MGENRYSGTGQPQAYQRLSVRQAADRLGISEGAIRSRIKRGTLRTERLGGRVYVVLGAGEPGGEPTDQPGGQADRTAELIATLREQLQAERRANEENRRIIAALTQRIPEIEAPPGGAVPPESPGPTATPSEARPGPQESAQRRSWWQRLWEG